MQITSLPAELLAKIADDVAQQSGLDLLAFSRTSSSLRRAARIAGRADLKENACTLGSYSTPYETLPRSRLLDTCIRKMPNLEFPVLDESKPEPPKTVLLLNFKTKDREATYNLNSSLFLREVHQQSVELWDLQDHTPRQVELPFARRIIRSTRWTDEMFSSELDGDQDAYPCLQLQTMSLGHLRVVLAQTFSERTFHLIDPLGRPYLAHNVSTHTEEPMPAPTKHDRKEAKRAAESDGRAVVHENWSTFRKSRWKAAHLPRGRKDDAEPGILFYHVPLHSKVLEWALLLPSPDARSSEVMSSGKLNLAWLTSSDRLPTDEDKLKLEALEPAADEGAPIIQLTWETGTGAEGDLSSRKVQMVHFCPKDMPALASGQESARSRVTCGLIPTRGLSPDGQPLLSKDRLRLFALFPSSDTAASNTAPSKTLRTYTRYDRDGSWPERYEETEIDGQYWVLGTFDDWLVMADRKEGSVKALRMSPAGDKVQTFHLVKTGRDGPRGPSHKPFHYAHAMHLTDGRVVLASDGLVGGILDLTTDGGPVLLEPAELIARCLARHSAKADNAKKSSSNNGQAHRESRLYWHGDADPNPGDERICVESAKEGSSPKPLILFVCSDELTGSVSSYEQYALLLHPRSGKIESVRHDFGSRLRDPCFSNAPEFKTATKRQVIVDDWDRSDNQVLIDFELGQAATVYGRRLVPVLGRWTNGMADLVLFRSPAPLDPEEPLRCWFYVSSKGTHYLKNPGDASPQEDDDDYEEDWSDDSDDEYDDYKYGRGYDWRLGVGAGCESDDDFVDIRRSTAKRRSTRKGGANGVKKRRLWSKILEILEETSSFAPSEQNFRTDERLKRRLLPNWLFDRQGAIYIGGVHRLISFLAGPDLV